MRAPAWVLWAGALAGASGGCDVKSSPPPQMKTVGDTRELQALSGLKLPSSARFVAEIGESGHDGTKVRQWLVTSPQKMTLPGKPVEIDSGMLMESLRARMPGVSIGKPVDSRSQSSLWQNKRGQWTADLVQTDRGFYLSVENIVLG